jgi:16S rRNA processing protein RimM
LTDAESHIIVGCFGAPYGVRGWLKVVSYTDPKSNILTYKPWQVLLEGVWQKLEIVTGRTHGADLVVQLPGCDDREIAARRYTGAKIAITHAQLLPLPIGDYYWNDLIGLEVVTTSGISLGHITQLLETGSNDVLVVEGERQRLIPYLPEQVVVKVDLANKKMQVEWDPEF